MPSTKPAARWADAAARPGRSGDGVRRGDERIGAVVDVEQHALRAFEQDALARAQRASSRSRHTGRAKGSTKSAISARSLFSRSRSTGGSPKPARSASWCAHRRSSSGSEIAELGEVADADRAAADLVLVSGADAAARRADLAGARCVLAQRVEVAVDRQDQRAGFGDHQDVGRDLDALLAHPLDLGLRSAHGSSTTPLPMTEGVPRTMPDGSSDSL